MSAQPSGPTTHIAALITAAHAAKVEVIYPPSDGELFDKAYLAYSAVRWPEQDEDTDAIINDARLAVRELYGRNMDLRSEVERLRLELKLERERRIRAVDAFDEQGEEVERLRGMLR